MSLFQHTIIKKQLIANAEKISKAYKLYADYFHNPTIQENIRNSKEEQFQEGFLRELFVKVFGYTLFPAKEYNLITEQKNEKDSKKADGAILVNGEVVGVIELKDTKTTDLKNIETQAFGYKNNNRKAVYVVTSNFEKLRFYIDNAIDYEEFNLFDLSEEKFAVLWLCLAYENIARNLPKQLKTESAGKEDQITKQLYRDYAAFKRALFEDLTEQNPDYDRLTLFKKSQKLLDRILFILFAEDCGLLPPNSVMEIVKQWQRLKDDDAYFPLYDRLKLYFGYMNTGRKGKQHDIFAYNGGLFAPDEVLNSVVISDETLLTHLTKVSNYDFSSEVDVNILGHIFENSLTEIEEITNEIITGEKTVSKRKKDGVFYTPRYITTYIVENTVGKLCADKKAELEIVESDYFADKSLSPKKRREVQTRCFASLQAYRDWLLSLTICDPACGSGAFLNAALDFLMAEHRLIDEMTAKLLDSSIVFPNIENAILENNLYGVDINDESVEIAKLSLWLRTAKPNRKLNALNNNIKCGNSLIAPITRGLIPLSDKEIEKTFDWHKEFPQVFKEKEKRAFHVTTATHDSRTSQRMIDYKVREMREKYNKGINPVAYADPRLMNEKDELIITQTIAEIVKEDKLNVLAYNICQDHLHILLVCEEEELDKIVGKIKGRTARACNQSKGINPLVKKEGERSMSFWTQKFGRKEIFDNEQLHNTIEYIENNRTKHELPINKGINPLVKEIVCTIDHAFRPEYKGGFDVIVGNPPYVRLESIREESEKLSTQNYKTYDKRGDLYQLFVERGFSILKESGYISYIMPNKWLQAGYGKVLREYFLSKELMQLIDFGDIQIFEGATTYPCIFIARNDKPKSEISVSVLQANNADDFYSNVAQTAEIFKTEQFSAETWVVSSQKDSQLLERLKNENITLEKFINGQSYRGVLTGLSEAFLINEETANSIKSENTTKPFLQGRDVKRYTTAKAESFLILFEKGFTNSSKGINPLVNPLVKEEEDAWNLIANNYPLTAKWLEPFAEKGKKRTDKGDFWWELRACDYYDKFAKPKIMYQKFQVKPCFIFDTNGLYCNDSMWIISTESKALLAVLNSKMGWWLISKYCTQIQNGYQLIWKYFGQIPIPEISDLTRGLIPLLTELADKMLSLNSELQTKRHRFLKRLSDNFAGIKITGKIETFDELEFAQFVSELAKQKIALTLKQQDEWEEYFTDYKTECNALSTQISATDKEIDGLVYGLYGLSEEEIKIVEGK